VHAVGGGEEGDEVHRSRARARESTTAERRRFGTLE